METAANNRKNLESLVEEDDEEESEATPRHHKQVAKGSSDESSDDEADTGMEREPNKFDNLTDGVVNTMALLQSSLQELLELKDKILEHALPPNVLIAIAVTTGKVFRSVSDLQMPVNELVRMVRLYSIPWEEKSTALKKLHENYEVKQRQLNKAINRLKLVDSHSKRIAKEKRVMNWEKLFAKIMGSRGHGRRWKFLIETIKQKAKLGLEHVQEYSRTLDESSDDEEDEEIPLQFKRQTDLDDGDSSDKPSDEDEKFPDDDRLDATAIESEPEEVETVTIDIPDDSEESDTEVPTQPLKKVRFAPIDEPKKTEYVKPQSADRSVWTHEPEYEKFLHVRIFKPDGLDYPDIKCSLAFGQQLFKTGVLNPEIEKVGKEKEKDPKAAKPAKRFEEFLLKLPMEKSDLEQKKQKEPQPSNFQVSVHQGQFEEIAAMATVELADLAQLDLKTVDEVDPSDGEDKKLGYDEDEDSLSDDVDISFAAPQDKNSYSIPKDDPMKDVDALPFPLFSLHAGRGEHKSCGTLPLILYYGRRLIPRTVSRESGTHGVNELVFELTGIDLHTTSKEDLQKEMKDEALSAVSFTPEPEEPVKPQEDTVLKHEYDRLIKKHADQLQHLQTEYEKKIQSLLDNLQEMQQVQMDQQAEITHYAEMAKQARQHADDLQNAEKQRQPHFTESPKSRKSSASGSKFSGPAALPPPVPPSVLYSSPQTLTPAQSPDKLNITVTPPRAHSLPKVEAVPYPPVHKPRRIHRRPVANPHLAEFFERLQMFEEESQRHRQELYERTMGEIKEELEKKLAGEHKLTKQEVEIYDALRDVSLPALFMPFKTGNIFNPRAHLYFHPTGSTDPRLTQPPSMLQLPPIPKDKMPVLNLFELSRNFQQSGPEWLMERYLQQREQGNHNVGFFPNTPAPTVNFKTYSPQQTPFPPQATQATIPLNKQPSVCESSMSGQGVVG